MAAKKRSPYHKTIGALSVLLVCFLLLGLLFPVSLKDLLLPEPWEHSEIEFASIEYVEPEEVSDWLPAWLGSVVEFLSWDDEQTDGWYIITDAEANEWRIDSIALEFGLDTSLLYQTVRPGDILEIWHYEEYVYAMSCGDVVFLDQEQAWKDSRANDVGLTVFFGIALVLALFTGRCLYRLRREGERYWRTLPKWIREME